MGWEASWSLLSCSSCVCVGLCCSGWCWLSPLPTRGKEPGSLHPRCGLQPHEPCCEAQTGPGLTPLRLMSAVRQIMDRVGSPLFKNNLKAG